SPIRKKRIAPGKRSLTSRYCCNIGVSFILLNRCQDGGDRRKRRARPSARAGALNVSSPAPRRQSRLGIAILKRLNTPDSAELNRIENSAITDWFPSFRRYFSLSMLDK